MIKLIKDRLIINKANSVDVVFKSVVALLLKLLASGLGLAFYFYLAKQLPSTEFGLFSLTITCLLFCSAFAKQGLEQSIVRFSALTSKPKTNESNERSFYRFVIIYSTLCSFVVLFFLFILSEFITNQVINQKALINLLPYVALLTVTQTWLAVNGSYLRGKGLTSLSILFSDIATLAFTIILCFYIEPNTALMVIKLYALAGSLACLSSFIVTLIKKKDIVTSIDITWDSRNEFISVSRSLFILSLTALLTQQLSVLVLARYVSIEGVGIFSLALKVSLLVSYPLIAVNAVTAPLYARYFANNQLMKFKKLANDSQRVLLIIATLLVLGIFLAIDNIALYFGEDYLKMAPIVKILLIGQWFNLATGSAISMLVMAGFEKTQRSITLVITAINVVSLFLVVPIYGLYGAAWVTAMAISIKNIVSFYFVNKLILKRVKSY